MIMAHDILLGPVGAILAVMGLVLVAGLVAGQFRRGVVSELRATLTTANEEMTIERARSDRLEREGLELKAEVAALRAEVTVLRTVIVDDRKIADSVSEALGDKLVHAIGMSTARIFEKLENAADELAKVAHETHKTLALSEGIDEAVNRRERGEQTIRKNVQDLHDDAQ